MDIHRIYKASLVLLLTAGLPIGCIAVKEKTDQAISSDLKAATPAVSPTAISAISYSQEMSGHVISTIAGGGAGDGGLAVEANLYTPQAVAVDSEGNIFICDSGNHRIRKVDAKTGIITTIAGSSIPGNLGDHGPALKAHLFAPHGLAFDPKGNLYIADTENLRIRKLDNKGDIHPVVGKKPDAVEMLMKKLSDHDHSKMFMPKGEGAERTLSPPHHLAVDSKGNVYITESENNQISKMDMTTGELTVIAGAITHPGYAGDEGPATRASLMNPHSVAVDAEGNVYIADTFNHRIRKVDAATGIITTIAGTGAIRFSGDGGPATEASLAGPLGIAVSPDGSVYFVDTDNKRIRKLTPSGSEWIVSTVAGTGQRGSEGDGGPALKANFVRPVGVAVDAKGNLYIADTGAHKIRKIDATGVITTVAGNGRCCFSGDGLPATHADFTPPYGITVDRSGHLYIVDRDNQRIRRVDGQTGVMTTVAGNGVRGYNGDGKPASKASLADPMGVAVGRDGSIFIADQGNHRIRKVDATTGIISTVVGTGIQGLEGDGGLGTAARLSLNSPAGVAIDGDGNLYISDTGNQRVRAVKDSTGFITAIAGSGTYGFSGDNGPATEADLANPTGLAFDQEGNLYIADTDNHRVRKVDGKTGLITTVVGNGKSDLKGDGGPAIEASLRYPAGISIDQENLYIADTGHDLIRVVSLKTGIITSVAGNGRPGFGGDGGPAAKAVLNSPHGITPDSKSIYIADTDNRLIRRIALDPSRLP